MDKLDRHTEVCGRLKHTYVLKNKAYGDSFGKRFKKHGILSGFIRIEDKFERLESLITKNAEDNGENIVDTLLDMANYCIMTVMELEEQPKNDMTF